MSDKKLGKNNIRRALDWAESMANFYIEKDADRQFKGLKRNLKAYSQLRAMIEDPHTVDKLKAVNIVIELINTMTDKEKLELKTKMFGKPTVDEAWIRRNIVHLSMAVWLDVDGHRKDEIDMFKYPHLEKAFLKLLTEAGVGVKK